MKRRAKILATLGPASSSPETIRNLIESGMDAVRLNMSHGDHGSHEEAIKTIKSLREDLASPLTIIADLQGPKLRTGEIGGEGWVDLIPGRTLKLFTDPLLGDQERISVNYPALPQDVSPGARILMDDGNIELRAVEIEAKAVLTEVVAGGRLTSRKGVNLPGIDLSIPSLTEKDREDLIFLLDQGVDAIAMSFVRKAEDLIELRALISENGKDPSCYPLISKLEKPEAIRNLEGILDESDGVMVARGDLGVELSPERIPSIQKLIIRRANAKLKFVITATQMLESMIEKARPTRAEASDVANAVFDGSDVLMLSGETSIGKHPKAAVETMKRIILDAEAHSREWAILPSEEIAPEALDDAVATTHAARQLAEDRDVSVIAVFTRSGRTACLMSKARPAARIMAFTPDVRTYQQLSILWGVTPFLVPMARTVEEMTQHVREACLSSGEVKSGDQVVLVASLPIGAMGPPNFTFLHTVE
jgi:pyruvate kinase